MYTLLASHYKRFALTVLLINSFPLLALEHESAATEYVQERCDTTRYSSFLPLLSPDCPIGQGLYGNDEPDEKPAFYWVQCGASSNPFHVDDTHRKVAIATQSNLVQSFDGEYYRCLSGPYFQYIDAKVVGRYISSLIKKETFLRQHVFISANRSQVTSVLKSYNEPKVVIETQQQVGEQTFFIPTYPESPRISNWEANQRWQRFSYEVAKQTCQSLNASLVTKPDIEALKRHIDVTAWPVALPFWLDEEQAAFLSGKSVSATPKSKLYLMCKR
ncbi:hypothetical protein C9980_10935 [Vibrio mediterranei]|uniref:hypothetical protein n=2 Tax=Vibrionaceae TaxID=641 RepID=UPI000D1835EE|nr:hypothetical protein [Vibrio mediterranei]PTC04809.1 hypothetical protein C9980_10935 [Vibrio mediterranei]